MIRVALFRGKGLVSALIRWQTRSAYSHVAVIVNDCLYEAWQGEGVRKIPYVQHLAKHGTEGIEIFEVTGRVNQRKVLEFLEAQVGKKYDYWGVIRFVSRRRMPENDKWFCSEYGFRAIQEGGVNLLERTEASEVSPGLFSRSPLLKE